MNVIKNFFRYFPPPEFLTLHHVGVDISETSIRFIELQRVTTKNSIILKRFGAYPLAVPLVLGSSLKDNKDLIAMLRKIRHDNRLTFVEVSIPENKAYLFTMKVAKGDRQSIRNGIEFHLEENVPISLSDAVFDYRIIKENKKTGTLFVSVSVIPQSVADDYVALFTAAGMTPISFMIESQALARAVVKTGDNTTYLIVHLDAVKTVLSVIADGAAEFTSTINVGSDDFTQAIMKEFNVAKEEAERIKRERGFSRSKEDEALFLSLINITSTIKDEIERICAYWQASLEKARSQGSEKPDVTSLSARMPIAKIILTGRDSSLSGFRDYLAVSVKTKVELGDVWSNVFSFDDSIPPIDYVDSLDYGKAVGLAVPTHDI